MAGRVFGILVSVSTLVLFAGDTQWTPAKCQVAGGSFAHEIVDFKPEMKYYECDKRVALASQKYNWSKECASIANLACIIEADKLKQ
jgi:hypothetical protein